MIGKRLRIMRILKNLSEAGIANKIGISEEEYISYEKDELEIEGGMLYYICEVLNVNSNIIFYDSKLNN